jgi:hypothetical protein
MILLGKSPYILATVDTYDVAVFAIIVLLVFFGLIIWFIANIIINRRVTSPSPYTNLPLRRGSEIPYMVAEKVLRFMYDMYQYDNRIFDVRKAALCRETGRLFPHALTWYGTIDVDWTFLQKRYPGNYVSWGSLSPEQQEIIKSMHDPLDGYQTEYSCPKPQPRAVERKYAFYKPGPLYVDLDTKVLLGWKCVPDTDLEVLIVQKPVHVMTISVT